MGKYYELKEGAGRLFQNDRKETDRHPDLKGEIKVEGVVYRVSAWRHQTKHGVIYFTLSAEASERRQLLGG